MPDQLAISLHGGKSIKTLAGKRNTYLVTSNLSTNDPRWGELGRLGACVVLNCSAEHGLESDGSACGGGAPIPYLTCPIIEMDRWPYVAFWRARNAIRTYSDGGRLPVVFHCRAGITRSMQMAVTQLLASGEDVPVEQHDRWHALVSGGRIPEDILDFLRLQDRHPERNADRIFKELRQGSAQGSS